MFVISAFPKGLPVVSWNYLMKLLSLYRREILNISSSF